MLKTKTKVKIGFVSVLSVAAGVQASSIVAQQAIADANTTFQVNVVESLSVSLTTDSSESTGGINTFLRSPVTLSVTSNNSKGFTASMHSSGDSTDLKSDSNAIKTLGDTGCSNNVTKSAFPVNCWGYNLQYNATTGADSDTGDTAGIGNDSSTYSGMTTSTTAPTTVMSRTSAATGTQKVWFGTKADASQASGSYTGSVVFSVVTGDIDSNTNPITPVNPADPDKPTDEANNPYYNSTSGYAGSSTNGATVYNTTTGGGEGDTTETTTTEISSGNTISSYADPHGVYENTVSNINSGAPLATGLAVTAGVAAVSGLIFFILAKRKKDDDEEEEQEQA